MAGVEVDVPPLFGDSVQVQPGRLQKNRDAIPMRRRRHHDGGLTRSNGGTEEVAGLVEQDSVIIVELGTGGTIPRYKV